MLVAPERPKGYLSTAIAIFVISLAPCLLLIVFLPIGNYFLLLLPFIGTFLLQRFLPRFLYNDECKQYNLELEKYRKQVKKQSALTTDGLQNEAANDKAQNKNKK
ncbi:hypothetical protein [Glaciecola sp. MF2-115]|uniref:hypothetical protein n=1 Tax=Glaciecola sp. MF2-115 TaxID=3384827 RepID=UPI0039A089C0